VPFVRIAIIDRESVARSFSMAAAPFVASQAADIFARDYGRTPET